MTATAIDASALLALLQNEPGADAVDRALLGGVISAVNYSEVVAKLADRGVPGAQITSALADLGLEVIEFDLAMAVAAGLLRRETASVGLSLGDRACIASARHRSLPVLTADRLWATLDLGVEVHVIR